MSAALNQMGYAETMDYTAFPQVSSGQHAAIVGDEGMKRLLALAESVAGTSSTVLLNGESGAGKEVVSRYIHDHSDRASGPFVAINCAALPPSLLESELFGHEKGSFSGAIKQHIGVFERAKGGTLLLDEVSEISPDMQAKLLRVLQERVLFRVGGTAPIKLDIRVIATTNRNLKEEIDKGTFRLDLYYRLNVFPLQIPALRDRPGDIRPLCLHFLAKANQDAGRELEGVTEAALQKLEAYAFPGNVRELVNVCERAMILSANDTLIRPEHIMVDAIDVAATPQARVVEPAAEDADVIMFRPGIEPFEDIRRRVILSTLERCEGNRTKTAEVLGLSLRTIRNRLKEYREAGIEVPAG